MSLRTFFNNYISPSQHHRLAALDELEILLGEGGEHDDRGGADVFALGDIFAAQVGVIIGDDSQ